MEARYYIWGKDFGLGGMEIEPSQKNELILELTNSFVQNQEYDICMANNWNLNQGSGSEILSCILKMSNNAYDFSMISDKVNQSTLKGMFCLDSAFKLNAPRQSSLYLANLRQVCELMKYDSFHTELMEFVEQEQISRLIDLDQVEKIHTDLEIKLFERLYQESIEELSVVSLEEEVAPENPQDSQEEVTPENPQDSQEEESHDMGFCEEEMPDTSARRKSWSSFATADSDSTAQNSPDNLIMK